MTAENMDLLAGCGIPQPDLTVVAPDEHVLAVRGKGYGPYQGGHPQGVDGLAADSVPQAGGVVPAPRHHLLAVRGKCDGLDDALMSTKEQLARAGGCVPQPGFTVINCKSPTGEHVFAVR